MAPGGQVSEPKVVLAAVVLAVLALVALVTAAFGAGGVRRAIPTVSKAGEAAHPCNILTSRRFVSVGHICRHILRGMGEIGRFFETAAGHNHLFASTLICTIAKTYLSKWELLIHKYINLRERDMRWDKRDKKDRSCEGVTAHLWWSS